jgi:hypothetical protein
MRHCFYFCQISGGAAIDHFRLYCRDDARVAPSTADAKGIALPGKVSARPISCVLGSANAEHDPTETPMMEPERWITEAFFGQQVHDFERSMKRYGPVDEGPLAHGAVTQKLLGKVSFGSFTGRRMMRAPSRSRMRDEHGPAFPFPIKERNGLSVVESSGQSAPKFVCMARFWNGGSV